MVQSTPMVEERMELSTEDRHSTISVEKDGCQFLKRTQFKCSFCFRLYSYDENLLTISKGNNCSVPGVLFPHISTLLTTIVCNVFKQ